MPLTTSYVFMVSMDVDADKENLFNEVYDGEHIPYLLAVPGVRGVSRLKGQPFAVSIAGDGRTIATLNDYTAPRLWRSSIAATPRR